MSKVSNSERSIQAAIRFIEERMTPERPLSDPTQDPRLLVMRQLHQLQLENLRAAELNQFRAAELLRIAQKCESEVRTRLELLEIDLGIEEKKAV